MKNSITFREITVAIGILVAVLVAFTLWVMSPEDEIGFDTTSKAALQSAIQDVIRQSVRIFDQMTAIR